MNCNYKVKITDIQNKYQFKILCKGGANSTNVNDIYNLLPTTTNENTDITISNTADIKAKSITIKGNTTQNTTTGRNIFDLKNATNQSGTIERTSDKTGFILRKGTNRVNNWVCSLPAGTYTIQFDLKLDNSTMSTQNLGFTPKDANQSNLTSGNLFTAGTKKLYTFTTTSDIAYLYFFINNSESSDCVATISNLMVMNGTISTGQDYEEYTNGASPNPSYPQDVINVTGLNTIKVMNKNLFNKDDSSLIFSGFPNGATNKLQSNANAKTAFIPCQPNKTYTISKTISARYIIADTSSDTIVADINVTMKATTANVASHTITTSANAKYLLVFYYLSSADTLSEEEIRNSIQIEYGSTATSYMAYQEKDYTINLGSIELCKIGTYQDYPFKENNKWYKYGAIGKVVLDGTQGTFSKPSTNRFNIDNPFTNYYKASNTISYISNLYVGYGQKSTNADFNSLVANESFGFDLSNSPTNYTIRIKDTRYNDITQFQTWLSNNNLILYYALATPTITEITDTTLIKQLNNISNNIRTFEGGTNISSTSAGANPIINITTFNKLS